MPRYECTEGGHKKFWVATVEGSTLTTHWGRIGTDGQSKDKQLASAEAANAELQKLVREKLAKGYVPVDGEDDTMPVAKVAVKAVPVTKAASTSKHSFPTLRARPVADGPYIDGPKDRPRITGHYAAGKRDGQWAWFDESGAPRRRAQYRAGMLHGDVELLHANGTPSFRGSFVDGLRHGVITEWSSNGKMVRETGYSNGVKHGDNKEYYPSGALRARYPYDKGEIQRPVFLYFENGRAQDESTADHERVVFADGSLYSECPLVRGEKHGKMKQLNQDGTPAVECEFVMGIRHGVETTWTDGKPTSVRYLCGAVAETVDNKALQKLSTQLAKKRDKFERNDLLREVTSDYKAQPRLLWHLIREGLYDPNLDLEMWEDLSQDAAITGKDVVTFLSGAKKLEDERYVPRFLSSWSRYLDEMVLNVYAYDPEPIDAAFDKLPKLAQDGVRSVRARFGHDERGKFARNIAADIAATYFRNGIGDSISGVGGYRREMRRFRDGALRTINLGETTNGDIQSAEFWPFIELFTTRDELTRELKKLVLAAEHGLPVYRVADVLKELSVAEMKKILDGFSCEDVPLVFETLRNDPPEVLLAWCKSTENERVRALLAALAIVRLGAAGKAIPLELDELLGDGRALSDVGAPWRNARTEPKSELDWLEQAWVTLPGPFRFGDPSALVEGSARATHELYRRALAVLPRERVDAVLTRFFAPKSYGGENAITLAVPYLTPALLHTIVAFVESEEPEFYGGSQRLALGVSCLGKEVLPLLALAKKKSKKKQLPFYERALLYSLAALAAQGRSWDAEYDAHIGFGPGHKADEFPFRSDYEHALRLIMATLPTDRALPIFQRAWREKREIALRTFVGIGYHPTEAVLQPAFELLLGQKLKLDDEEKQRITAALVPLREDGPPIVEWVLAERGSDDDDLKSAFWQCMGPDFWKKREGDEEPEEVDYFTRTATERLEALDEALSGLKGKYAKVPIYAPLPERPEKPGYNKIGGVPPGVGAAEWPMAPDGDPMQFLFMIDLEDLPDLAKRAPKGSRAFLMFISSADHHRAYDAGNDEVKMMYLDEKALAKKAEAPAEAKLIEERAFAWRTIDVPEAIFEMDDENEDDDEEHGDDSKTAKLRRVRDAVYKLGARANGEPIFPQSGELVNGFLLQFDETFVSMNLAGNGVMFVYEDTAFFRR